MVGGPFNVITGGVVSVGVEVVDVVVPEVFEVVHVLHAKVEL